MTEFALALPVFLILVVGVIEIGHLLYLFSSVYAGAREAARYGASVNDDPGVNRFADCDGIRNQARRIAFLSNLTDGQIDIVFDNPDYGSLADLDCSAIAADPDLVGLEQNKYNRITVTVETNYRPLIPIINFPDMPIRTSVGRTIIRNLYFRNYASQQISNPSNPPNPPASTCPEITGRTINTGTKMIEYTIDNPTDESMIFETLSVFWLGNTNQYLDNMQLFPAGGSIPVVIWEGPNDYTRDTHVPNEGPWLLVNPALPVEDSENTAIRTLPPQSVGNLLLVQFAKNPDLGPGITLEINFNHGCIGINDQHVP